MPKLPINNLRHCPVSNRLLSSGDLCPSPGKLKPFDAIPGPKGLPVIGNVWRYLPLIGDYKLDNLFENAQINKAKYGSIVRERITKEHTVLHLFNPQDVEEYFRQDGKYPYRRSHRALMKYRHSLPEYYKDGGLFPENGPNWYRQRGQFQRHLMSKSKVNDLVPVMDNVAAKIVGSITTKLKGRDELVIENFQELIYRWALASSLAVFIGLDIDSLDQGYVDKTIEQLHNSLEAIGETEIKSQRWINQPERCKHYRMLAESQQFLYDLVAKNLDKKSNMRPIFIDDWLHKDRLDRRDVVSLIIDLLMAGLHTTSFTTLFLLRNIVSNFDILEGLRKEFSNCHPGGQLDGGTVERLVELKDCLKETLRLNPISIGTGRLTSGDISLRGFHIPQGTMIIVQSQSMSRDGSIFQEANEFKPNRWAEYRVRPKEKRPSPFACLPFGFGARACIGQRIAELQIKIFTSRLLEKFDINFENEIKTKTMLIHVIDGNVRLIVKLKQGSNQ